ncbi:oxidase [uncultured Tenacibaculum sp.]|uniref:oxidase n=1 Tax=uncultured Tenacibaculum sp. TaxID=174713 RepID=UPI0026227749|nr:oxidase [uncultured Tenacibaculum sp.]
MNDFKLDETGDLLIVNGDFVVTDATLQHQEHIILAQKGEYKEYPEIGVGISNMLNDENPRDVITQIRRNFQYDGMEVKQLDFDPAGDIVVEAPYREV